MKLNILDASNLSFEVTTACRPKQTRRQSAHGFNVLQTRSVFDSRGTNAPVVMLRDDVGVGLISLLGPRSLPHTSLSESNDRILNFIRPACPPLSDRGWTHIARPGLATSPGILLSFSDLPAEGVRSWLCRDLMMTLVNTKDLRLAACGLLASSARREDATRPSHSISA